MSPVRSARQALRRLTPWPGPKTGHGAGWKELPYLLPLLVVIGLVIAVPTVEALMYSLTNWNPGYASPWVGLQNYAVLLGSAQFREILGTQGYLLLGLPVWTFLPLAIATLLAERVPWAGVFRSIYFFPSTASPAVIGIVFSFLLAPNGPANHVLQSIGLGWLAADWLANVAFVRPILIAVVAWATMGTGVVIFSAALGSISPDLLEAAKIDGSSWWQTFVYIILPNLKSVVQLWVVILVISSFTAMFPWIFTLTQGGPGYASTTIDYSIYQNALTFGYFGLAAAETGYLLLILAIVLGVINWTFSRWKT